MTFDDLLRERSAERYADFVLPLLSHEDRVIDVGCGPGSITLGLARDVEHVTGVDVDEEEFADARVYASSQGVDNVTFRQGSIYELSFEDSTFDAATLFAMLETLDDPLAGLAEVRRVLKPGAILGASSIEYGGLVLRGPDEPLLRRFYELRLAIWKDQGDVHPYRGRELRGLLRAAGFTDVEANLTYFSYGTEKHVRAFGLGRAEDCRDEWYVEGVTRLGLAGREELDALERTWTRWAESPDAFAAFAWGRATGRNP